MGGMVICSSSLSLSYKQLFRHVEVPEWFWGDARLGHTLAHNKHPSNTGGLERGRSGIVPWGDESRTPW